MHFFMRTKFYNIWDQNNTKMDTKKVVLIKRCPKVQAKNKLLGFFNFVHVRDHVNTHMYYM